MWEHPLGAFAAYKGIITIVSCANIVSGFVTSFKVSHPVPLHYIYGESEDIIRQHDRKDGIRNRVRNFCYV